MKREELFKASLQPNCSLKEALETLGVEELKGVCFYIQLAEEQKGEKESLIAYILEKLPDAARRFAFSFDLERFDLFQSMLNVGGVLCANKLSVRKILALRDLGLAFPTMQDGECVLVIPQEIQDVLCSLNRELWGDAADYNTKLLQRAQGAVQLYGFLETEQFIRVCMGSTLDDPWEDVYFLEVLYDAILYHGTIEPEDEGFRHRRFWNYEYVRNKQKELHSIGDYKAVSLETLQSIGKRNGITWDLSMERFKQFLVREGKMTKATAKREVEAAWYELNNGIPLEDVCHYLVDWYFSFATKDVQDAVAFYALQMYSCMPQWVLKGFSYSELEEAEERKRKEVKCVELP